MWWKQRIHPQSDEGNKILQTTKKGGRKGNRERVEHTEEMSQDLNPLTL